MAGNVPSGDVGGIRRGRVRERRAQVGVLLDEAGGPSAAQPGHVLPHEHLGVAVRPGADADVGDAQRLVTASAAGEGTISMTTAKQPAASSAKASSMSLSAPGPATLHLVPAEHVLALRGEADVTHDGDAGAHDMDRQQEFVLRTIEERDIRFVRLWFTDVLGTLKSVGRRARRARGRLRRGDRLRRLGIEGFARVYEADMLAKPDPSTFQVLPWRGEAPGPRGCSATCSLPDGSPASPTPARPASGRWPRPPTSASRSTPTRDRVLPAQAPRGGARDRPSRSTRPATSTTCRTAPPTTSGARRSRCWRTMGISVEFSHHEGAPGQNEIDLRYADALSTADNIMTFRTVVKEVALEQGIYASFMPKPFAEHPGVGHAHPPVASSRATPTPSTRRARPTSSPHRAGSSSPACCATAPRSPR
jgi:hypothetical protein